MGNVKGLVEAQWRGISVTPVSGRRKGSDAMLRAFESDGINERGAIIEYDRPDRQQSDVDQFDFDGTSSVQSRMTVIAPRDRTSDQSGIV
jgi:hypothetical protein